MTRLLALVALALCLAAALGTATAAAGADQPCKAQGTAGGGGEYTLGEGEAKYEGLSQAGTTCGRARTVAGTFVGLDRCDDGACVSRRFACKATGKAVFCMRARLGRRVTFTLR